MISNHYMRVLPDDRPEQVVGGYTETNNLGTTRVLRAFAPALGDGGTLLVVASTVGTLHYLAPVLHERFDQLETLEHADAAVRRWRDAVQDGSALAEGWPAFMNIPSKIGQVGAVRAIARKRRESDLERGILLASVCPGMIDTPASRPWFDMAAPRLPPRPPDRLSISRSAARSMLPCTESSYGSVRPAVEAVSSSSGPVPAEESLGKLLKRTEQTLLRAKSAAVKTVGLTLPQYVALVELAARPGITGAELARACLVSPQAMMVVLKAMEEQGLVERTQHPLHQTVLEIHLTRVGREAFSSAGECAQPIERRIAEALSSKELETLKALLRRCIDAVADTA